MFCETCDLSVINKYIKKKSCPFCKGKKLLELNGTDIKTLIKQKEKVRLSDKFVYSFFKKNNFSLQID